VMCLEKEEKEKKKSFTMELVQQQYVCGVFREREKKSFAMELVLQYFLLSILMTTYIYVAFKILEPS
jgi:hypothetical protein